MSSLQKTILKNKLPPRIPRSSGIPNTIRAARRKDYSPVSWTQYFERHVDVETEGGTFRVYLSPEPDHPSRPRIFTLHGGGYSGLSWSLFTEEITNMIHCQVVSMDIRGHGETKVKDPDDLSIETLVSDVEQVIQKLYDEEPPPLILLGHSMGGAIAVRAAHSPILEHYIHGLAVIDVVEGTAMEALASMQSFLRGRPTHFKSIEHAIEWCVRSGQVRNVDSAKVSMPSQILNCQTGTLAINEVDTYTSEGSEARVPAPSRHAPHADRIAEESDESDDCDESDPKLPRTDSTEAKLPSTDSTEAKLARTDSTDSTFSRSDSTDDSDPNQVVNDQSEATDTTFAVPHAVGDSGAMKYKWRIDLSRTEKHWAGWFGGLSNAFLHTRAPRLLLLASVDGLDRELTVGQMQGKFQMQVLTRCGHAVHEDTPERLLEWSPRSL